MCDKCMAYSYRIYYCINAHIKNYYCPPGFVEICLMHPLDLVKTRFQIQGGADDPSRYRSIGHCFRTMYQTEG